MSAPVPATTASAVRVLMPGMEQMSVRKPRKGSRGDPALPGLGAGTVVVDPRHDGDLPLGGGDVPMAKSESLADPAAFSWGSQPVA